MNLSTSNLTHMQSINLVSLSQLQHTLKYRLSIMSKPRNSIVNSIGFNPTAFGDVNRDNCPERGDLPWDFVFLGRSLV